MSSPQLELAGVAPGPPATGPGAPCAYCGAPIPDHRRSDATLCGKRCKQAAYRERRPARVRRHALRPLRLGYADPPYPGLARTYYALEAAAAGRVAREVNHRLLIAHLEETFDAWALSTSARALPAVLKLCPDDVRVAVWERGHRPHRGARTPLAAWEPLIVRNPRQLVTDRERLDVLRAAMVDDVLDKPAKGRRYDPRAVTGGKPPEFVYWMLDQLGALPGDELVDLFPGSGIVGRCWTHYTAAGLPVAQDLEEAAP